MSLQLGGSDIIGKTIESEKYPITMDEFWFSIAPDKLIGPFDFVSVENVQNTVTIGIVKELRTTRNREITPSNEPSQKDYYLGDGIKDFDNCDQGIRIARVAIMTNARVDIVDSDPVKFNAHIRMTIGINRNVRFANEREIFIAFRYSKNGRSRNGWYNRNGLWPTNSYTNCNDIFGWTRYCSYKCYRNFWEFQNFLSNVPITFYVSKDS